MKPLTDALVAKALGWSDVESRRTSHHGVRLCGVKPGNTRKAMSTVPAFTKSLDAIVEAAKALGKLRFEGILWRMSGIASASGKEIWTDPQAWCRAVMDEVKGGGM